MHQCPKALMHQCTQVQMHQWIWSDIDTTDKKEFKKEVQPTSNKLVPANNITPSHLHYQNSNTTNFTPELFPPPFQNCFHPLSGIDATPFFSL